MKQYLMITFQMQNIQIFEGEKVFEHLYEDIWFVWRNKIFDIECFSKNILLSITYYILLDIDY